MSLFRHPRSRKLAGELRQAAGPGADLRSKLMTAGDPDQTANPWDSMIIDGKVVPGIIDLPDIDVGRRLDDKGIPGSGFILTDKGEEAADLKFAFKLWTDEHFQVFEEIYRKYLSPRRPLSDQTIVTVVHPSLYLAGIRQVYFYKASGIQGHPGGAYIIHAAAKEYRPPPKTQSHKPKSKVDYSGLGGKWTQNALNKVKPIADQLQGLPVVQAIAGLLAPKPIGPPKPPKARSPEQWRKDAAAGDPDAQLTVKMLDGKAAATR